MTKKDSLRRYACLIVIVRKGCHAAPVKAHRACTAASTHYEMHAGKATNSKDASCSTSLMFGRVWAEAKQFYLFVSPVDTYKLHRCHSQSPLILCLVDEQEDLPLACRHAMALDSTAIQLLAALLGCDEAAMRKMGLTQAAQHCY